MKKLFLLLFFLSFISACGYRYTWEDPVKTRMVRNYCFDASIEPAPNYHKGFNSFLLRVKNKIDKELTIDWNRSFYIRDGATNGGIDYQNRCHSNKKEPDIIFPGGTFVKYIFPDVFLVPVFQGCDHEYLPVGNNGIMLSVICEKKEIHEIMNVQIREK